MKLLPLAVLVALFLSVAAPAFASTSVGVSPGSIPTGGTVTITVSFGASAPGASDSVNTFQVCTPGTTSAPCPGGSTVYSYTGPLPTFSCNSGSLCAGKFVVTFPSSSPGICSITTGSGTCTPTSASCATVTCWSSGANTNTKGSYGVLVLYTSTAITGTFSADNGFVSTTPQFQGPMLLVAATGVLGLSLLRKKFTVR